MSQDVDERAQAVAAEIGEEGTLASIQARIPKLHFDPATESMREEEMEEEGGFQAGEGEPEAKAEPEKREPEVEKPLKYRNRREAEKAAIEATRKMTEATTETAKEKAAREQAEKEAADARAELQELKEKLKAAEEDKPKEPKEPVVSEEDREAAIEEATFNALAEIAQLEPPARGDEEGETEHRKAAARIWSKALKTAGVGGISKEGIAQLVRDTIAAQKAEEQKQVKTVKEQEAQASLWDQALELAKASGLDTTEDSQDFADFYLISHTRLGKQDFMRGEAPPLQKQVDWVVAEVKKAREARNEKEAKKRETTRRAQTVRQPLGRGTTPTKETSEPESTDGRPSYTMADIQESLKSQARARHKGT